MHFVSLHGAYYPNNYGDVLILNIEAEWIKELTGKDVSLPFATDIYRSTLQSNQVTGKDSIIQSDYLIYGAGGFLGEPPADIYKWSLNFLKNHLKPAMLAKKHKVPYSIIGTGVGPVSAFYGKAALKYIAKNAEIIAVRDQESKDYIAQLVDKNKPIYETADVALSLTKESIPKQVKDQVQNEYLNFDGLKIGIHIGADRHSSEHGANVQMVIDETIQFFNQNEHLTPVLIIDNDNQVQREAVDFIASRLKQNHVLFKHQTIWETTALLAELDTVITNKLHIGIVNYAMGNVPISIPYHSKTKRFYKQIGLEELCTPISEINKGLTLSLLNQISTDVLNGNKGKYQIKREEMKAKALNNKMILEKILNHDANKL